MCFIDWLICDKEECRKAVIVVIQSLVRTLGTEAGVGLAFPAQPSNDVSLEFKRGQASRREAAKTYTWIQFWPAMSTEQLRTPLQPSGRERFVSGWKFTELTHLIGSPSQIALDLWRGLIGSDRDQNLPGVHLLAHSLCFLSARG